MKPRPLLQIVSIAPTGRVTHHWQIPGRELAQARRMAQRVASRLGSAEVVKIRREVEVVTTYTEEIEVVG